MVINSNKLWKYLSDAGLINEIESKLKYYIYFLDYVGEYMPYINGAGMDFDTMYTYEVEKIMKYNDEEIYYSHETDTFRGDEGYTPEKYSKGKIISTYNADLKDKNLNELYTKEKLENAIIADYGITDEVINNFYNNNLKPVTNNTEEIDNSEELARLYKEIDEIDFKINDKKSVIESLKKAINYLEIEKEIINKEIEKKNSKTK